MKLLSVIFLVISLPGFGQVATRISGRVLDDSTQQPLVLAHVGIVNTSIGTVTNVNGAFSLLIPADHRQSNLYVSHVGYETQPFSIDSITGDRIDIALTPSTTPLPELTIGASKVSLIQEAIDAIPRNHDQGEMVLSGFWRAQIKDSSAFMQLSEIAFDIYRKNVGGKMKNQLKIQKGRLGRDTLAFKQLNNFQAGIPPESLFANSFLKNHTVLSFRTLKTSDYVITGITSYEGRPVYVISFDKKPTIKSIGYAGEILLDQESLAFVKINYQLSPSNTSKPPLFQPNNSAVSLNKGTWERYEAELNFQSINERWYLSHASFDATWRLIQYYAELDVMIDYHADLVVTNIDTTQVIVPSDVERSNKAILEAQADFTDENFWKDYVQLVPEIDYDEVFRKISERNRN